MQPCVGAASLQGLSCLLSYSSCPSGWPDEHAAVNLPLRCRAMLYSLVSVKTRGNSAVKAFHLGCPRVVSINTLLSDVFSPEDFQRSHCSGPTSILVLLKTADMWESSVMACFCISTWMLKLALHHVIIRTCLSTYFFPFFPESPCPASLRTASTVSRRPRWTDTAGTSSRATWWRARARWGRCAGTTCWCTGSTSRTDTCEGERTGSPVTKIPAFISKTDVNIHGSVFICWNFLFYRMSYFLSRLCLLVTSIVTKCCFLFDVFCFPSVDF